MPEQMLDLGREVEGQVRVLAVQCTRDAQGVGGAVQEVGIPEREVTGAGRDLAPRVGEHRRHGHGKEPAAVDGHDRAVTAQVLAAAAGLDVACGHPATGLDVARITGEGELVGAVGDGERHAVQVRTAEAAAHGDVRHFCGFAAGQDRAREGDEHRLDLACDHGVPVRVEQMLRVQPGIVAVERDVRARVQVAHAGRGLHPQAQRCVHGDRHEHQRGGGRVRRGERLDGEVHGARVEPRLPQRRQRPGEPEGRVAELVASEEKDARTIWCAHAGALRATCFSGRAPPCLRPCHRRSAAPSPPASARPGRRRTPPSPSSGTAAPPGRPC